MELSSIASQYTLPSLGKIYGREFDPIVTLRSMTTADEMRRLNPTERPCKAMAEIIDSCIEQSLPISSYDMCLGDYQYLLHRLRVVTYGAKYPVVTVCPYCGVSSKQDLNLEDLPVLQYTDNVLNLMEFDLPKTGKHSKLRFQTPRMLDEVALQAKELRKKQGDAFVDPTLSLTVESMIDTVDGHKPDLIKLSQWVSSLPMMDTNIILQRAEKLNSSIGVSRELDIECDACGLDYKTQMPMNAEFFRPSADL